MVSCIAYSSRRRPDRSGSWMSRAATPVPASARCSTLPSPHHGIDLSRPAIDLASEHVARLPCVATLEHSDFAEALRQRSEPADVIWLGQSLHHLDGSAKLAVMRDVRRLLTDHGQFLLWEPTRFDGESREAWLER